MATVRQCGGASETPPTGRLRRAVRAMAAKVRRWRTARALDELRKEVNARWPNRSKASDGTIGDAAHASRDSDHNPWIVVKGIGVVRAFDITAEGIDADALAEYLRARGKAGDPRLKGGGYIIWKGRIASERENWAWRTYTGPNKHTKHIHVSFSKYGEGFDSSAPWGVDLVARPAEPNAGRHYRTFVAGATDALIYKLGGRDNQVAELQLLFRLPVSGTYDPRTVQAVVNLKKLAQWADASGAQDRSSRVDERFIKAVRVLVAAQ